MEDKSNLEIVVSVALAILGTVFTVAMMLCGIYFIVYLVVEIGKL